MFLDFFSLYQRNYDVIQFTDKYEIDVSGVANLAFVAIEIKAEHK